VELPLRYVLKTSEPIYMIYFGTLQRSFVVAVQSIRTLFEYVGDRIFESYFSNESRPSYERTLAAYRCSERRRNHLE